MAPTPRIDADEPLERGQTTIFSTLNGDWPKFTPEWLLSAEIEVLNNIRPWSYKKVETTVIQKNVVL